MTLHRAAAAEFRRHHYALVRGFVPANILNDLSGLAATASWRACPLIDGPVRQHKDEAVLDRPSDIVPLERCAQLLHEQAVLVGFQSWEPNEFTLNRYVGTSAHITAHRDSVRYIGLVAVLTLYGRANFRICRTRAGPTVQQWLSRPGDLVLMRGARPGAPDERPYHAVDGPVDGARLTLSARCRVD